MLVEMNSKKRVFGVLRNFTKSEDGVVTVEWVALAGAVLVGAIAIGWIVLNGLQTPANNISGALASCESLAAKNSGSVSGCQ